MKTGTWLILLLLAALLMVPLAGSAADTELKYVDKDTLKDMLGAPNLLIIDVRQPTDWNGSDKKIQGAVRQEPNQAATWGPNLSKDKKIVLYCA